MDSEEIKTIQDNKGIGLAIASLVLGIVSLIPTIFSAYMSIASIIISHNPNSTLGDGIGSALMVILLIPLSIVAFLLSAIGLGLGIGSLTKAKTKKTKSIGISGTVISSISLLVSIVSLLLRVII